LVQIALPPLPHVVSPFGQLHTPATHESPAAHALPQAPQLFGSVAVSTQPMTAPQLISVPGHAQAPPVHAEPAGH
jgi:hypothetical protein